MSLGENRIVAKQQITFQWRAPEQDLKCGDLVIYLKQRIFKLETFLPDYLRPFRNSFGTNMLPT